MVSHAYDTERTRDAADDRGDTTQALQRVGRLAMYALMALAAIVWAGPLVWMLVSSLKPEAEIYRYPIEWIPENPTLDAYRQLFAQFPMLAWFRNSLIVGVVTTVVTVAFSALAAYPLARMNFRGKGMVLIVLLATFLMPYELLLVPLFLGLNMLGVSDSYFSLSIPPAANALGIFILLQFFKSLPKELEEAAIVDGCSRLGFFFRILLPLSIPSLATVAILTFVTSWNNLFWAADRHQHRGHADAARRSGDAGGRRRHVDAAKRGDGRGGDRDAAGDRTLSDASEILRTQRRDHGDPRLRLRVNGIEGRTHVGTVRLADVHKSYDALEVLHDIDAFIDEGEFVVLVGPSGCGKSTLLRMIAGLEEITAGDIAIDGRVVNRLLPKDRDIAMVFQNYALYPHMRVSQNMGFALRLARVPKAEIDSRVEDAAEILGLTTLLERYPRELSGGQRQRVAMGRAIVRKPSVFLFDEPLSNLDAKLRVTMRAEIKSLHRRLGNTMVYVTHDQIEAMTMADRILVLNGGKIEQVGTPLELYDDPDNIFVAGFIGSPAMNFIEGRIVPDGDTPRFAIESGEMLDLPSGLPLREGAQVVAGVRPEHFRPASDGLPFEVELREITGSETMLNGRIGKAEVTLLVRGRIDVEPGDILPLRAASRAVYVFDKETGRVVRPASA